ncbi:hypothetical protein SASPL_112235 [Salvia splendens]|uniref:Methionyl aminopeptidase n=1 Tax=Salvia splendens TaxID=180675 RepID=A0A8X8YC96_SALSN|nr:hypothetical protein SASPL_112235 [Salvia splendens]
MNSCDVFALGFFLIREYRYHIIFQYYLVISLSHGALTRAGNKAVGVMKAGQTFTIEPMINSGVWRDRMWPDGWTSVTADGKRSAQFEHTLLVKLQIQDVKFLRHACHRLQKYFLGQVHDQWIYGPGGDW